MSFLDASLPGTHATLTLVHLQQIPWMICSLSFTHVALALVELQHDPWLMRRVAGAMHQGTQPVRKAI